MDSLNVREGFKKKKSCNIVTTYVGGRMGNYTKFIFFFMVPIHPNLQRNFFVGGGGGLGGGW